MTPESTLKIVRELSENATLRPADKVLALATPEEIRPGPQWAIIPYEELHPARIGGGVPCRASGYKQRKVREFAEAEPKKDFMAAALEKTAA